MAAKNNRLGRHWETLTIQTATRGAVPADIRFETGTGLWHGYIERPNLAEIHVSSKLYEEVLDRLEQAVPEQLQPVYRPYLRIQFDNMCLKESHGALLIGAQVVTLTTQPVEFSQYFPREGGRLRRDGDGRVRLHPIGAGETIERWPHNREDLYIDDTPENRALAERLARELIARQNDLHSQLRALAVNIDDAHQTATQTKESASST